MNIEIFTFLHLKFDVTMAKKVALKYKPEEKQPSLDWIMPLVSIDEDYVPFADLLKTVIFAVVPQGGTATMKAELQTLLIDGNHTVTRAVREGVPFVYVVTLTVADSLKILKSRKDIRDSIRAEARKLGLL